jgi:DNA-binding protein HU-beta
MNKLALISHVAEVTTLPKRDARTAIDAVLDGVMRGLQMDGKVSLVGFGVFYLGKNKGRTGRNPRTGEAIQIPERVIPKFKASKQLREIVSKVGA